MNIWASAAGCVVAYWLIGIVVSALVSWGDDDMSAFIAMLWPLFVALAILLACSESIVWIFGAPVRLIRRGWGERGNS